MGTALDHLSGTVTLPAEQESRLLALLEAKMTFPRVLDCEWQRQQDRPLRQQIEQAFGYLDIDAWFDAQGRLTLDCEWENWHEDQGAELRDLLWTVNAQGTLYGALTAGDDYRWRWVFGGQGGWRKDVAATVYGAPESSAPQTAAVCAHLALVIELAQLAINSPVAFATQRAAIDAELVAARAALMALSAE